MNIVPQCNCLIPKHPYRPSIILQAVYLDITFKALFKFNIYTHEKV